MMQVEPIVRMVPESLVIGLVENPAGGSKNGTQGASPEDGVDREHIVLDDNETYPGDLALFGVGVEVAHIVGVELGEGTGVDAEDVREVADFVDGLRLLAVDSR
jgi:hypothetical protein